MPGVVTCGVSVSRRASKRDTGSGRGVRCPPATTPRFRHCRSCSRNRSRSRNTRPRLRRRFRCGAPQARLAAAPCPMLHAAWARRRGGGGEGRAVGGRGGAAEQQAEQQAAARIVRICWAPGVGGGDCTVPHRTAPHRTAPHLGPGCVGGARSCWRRTPSAPAAPCPRAWCTRGAAPLPGSGAGWALAPGAAAAASAGAACRAGAGTHTQRRRRAASVRAPAVLFQASPPLMSADVS